MTAAWTRTRSARPPSSALHGSLSAPTAPHSACPEPTLVLATMSEVQEGGRREGRRRFSRIPTHAAKVPSRPARWKCFPVSSRTASFPTPCLGPASAPRRPGFLPQFPSRLRSARRPCTGRVLTPRPPPGLLPGSALPARPWSLFPETQVDKAPSVTCPPTSPLLPCLTASVGQALGGWRTGRGRGGGRRARGRARTTLARASRRGGFGGRRPRAAETTQAQGALRRRRWGD